MQNEMWGSQKNTVVLGGSLGGGEKCGLWSRVGIPMYIGLLGICKMHPLLGQFSSGIKEEQVGERGNTVFHEEMECFPSQDGLAVGQ